MATNNTANLRSDEQRGDEILSRIPAGRWGTPEDIAGAAIFLASEASSYVNGFTPYSTGCHIIIADGLLDFSAMCRSPFSVGFLKTYKAIVAHGARSMSTACGTGCPNWWSCTRGT